MSTYNLQTLRSLGLSERTAQQVLPHLKITSRNAKDLIWGKGQPVDNWWFVISGVVAFTVPVSPEEDTPIDITGSGSWFGEQSLVSDQPAPYDTVCLTSCDFLVMPGHVFNRLLETETGFTRKVTSLIAERSAQQSEMLTMMKLGNPGVRVVRGIAQLADALTTGQAGNSGPGDDTVALPMKQAVLASLCGVSRTVLSELLQRLQEFGWVDIRYGTTRVCRMPAWKAFLNDRVQPRVINMTPSVEQLLQRLSGVGDAVLAAA